MSSRTQNTSPLSERSSVTLSMSSLGMKFCLGPSFVMYSTAILFMPHFYCARSCILVPTCHVRTTTCQLTAVAGGVLWRAACHAALPRLLPHVAWHLHPTSFLLSHKGMALGPLVRSFFLFCDGSVISCRLSYQKAVCRPAANLGLSCSDQYSSSLI